MDAKCVRIAVTALAAWAALVHGGCDSEPLAPQSPGGPTVSTATFAIHTFDEPSLRALRPRSDTLAVTAADEWASESPLDYMAVRYDNKGARGSRGYLTLIGTNADQFYAESTPYWWVPSRTFDLRGGRTSFYLPAITPITVSGPAYQPGLFVAAYVENEGYTTLILKDPLTVGAAGNWAHNVIDIPSDPERWLVFRDTHVITQLSVPDVLRNVGFIGVMYHNLSPTFGYRGVNATGILGIDEFEFGK